MTLPCSPYTSTTLLTRVRCLQATTTLVLPTQAPQLASQAKGTCSIWPLLSTGCALGRGYLKNKMISITSSCSSKSPGGWTRGTIANISILKKRPRQLVQEQAWHASAKAQNDRNVTEATGSTSSQMSNRRAAGVMASMTYQIRFRVS